MPVRVELIGEAVEDLVGYARSGNIQLFLKKLVRLESIGAQAGEPLGRSVMGLSKIVVGDRDWRIVFRMSDDEQAATILVIGDRDDSACYETAARRLEALSGSNPIATSLAAAMLELPQLGRRPRRDRR